MGPLMPSCGKEAHVYRPAQSKARRTPRTRKGAGSSTTGVTPATAAPALTTHTAAATGSAITVTNDLEGVVMNDDPNFSKASTPLTHLSLPSPSASSSAITSVSRGKRKASTSGVDSAGAASETKRSRPLSAQVQAQVKGSEAMDRLVNVLETMFGSHGGPLPTPPQPGTSSSAVPVPSVVVQNHDTYAAIIDQAGDALVTLNLPADQNIAISAYMRNPENIDNVRFFNKFNRESRESWIKEVLNEIWAAKARSAQIK